MKKGIMVIAILVTIWMTQSFANEKTIAILDFSNNSLEEKEKYASLSSGLAEILITELSQISSLQVVERKKINEIIKEMQLVQSGLVSEETGVQVGRLVGAKYLVFGSFMVIKKKVRVDTRIVEVETGLTVKATQVTKDVSKMFEIIQALTENILTDLNIALSAQEENLLASGETSNEVIELFSEGLAFEEANDLLKAKEHYVKAFKLDEKFVPVRKRLKALLLRMQSESN